jgi:hypothetical protein
MTAAAIGGAADAVDVCICPEEDFLQTTPVPESITTEPSLLNLMPLAFLVARLPLVCPASDADEFLALIRPPPPVPLPITFS